MNKQLTGVALALCLASGVSLAIASSLSDGLQRTVTPSGQTVVAERPTGFKPLFLLLALGDLGFAFWQGRRWIGRSDSEEVSLDDSVKKLNRIYEASPSSPRKTKTRRERIKALEGTVEHPDYQWAKHLLGHPNVLIWGEQGSGKSSFARWLVEQRLKMGHQMLVFDPHAAHGHWQGLKLVGGGMNWEEIDQRMEAVLGEMEEDYLELYETPGYEPIKTTFLVEELTTWARRCSNAPAFQTAFLGDSRKISKYLISVAHDNTLAATGGSKGYSKSRKNQIIELKLIAKQKPGTDEMVAAGYGELLLPGKEKQEIKVGKWMQGSHNFSVLTETIEADSSKQKRSLKLTSESEIESVTPSENELQQSGLVRNSRNSSESNALEDSLEDDCNSSDSECNSCNSSVNKDSSLLRQDGDELPSWFTELDVTAQESLFWQCKYEISNNSLSWVIKNLLRGNGRNYAEGKKVLTTLIKTFSDDSDNVWSELNN